MILKTFRTFEGGYSDESVAFEFQLDQQDVTRSHKMEQDADIFLALSNVLSW